MKKLTSQFKARSYSLILLIVLLFFSVAYTSAAEISFNTRAIDVSINEQFEASIFLNTENEDINAIEGVVTFPKELLELEEIKDGNSIISFWIESPNAISGNEIHFSGVVPGGYTGKNGAIFSMVFRAKRNGIGIIKIHNVRILRNDGNGTGVDTTISNLKFAIFNRPNKSEILHPNKDTDPPESFKPIITQSPDVFDGKYFLVFVTQDKGSGIDHYEVSEGGGKFMVAASPYLLKNQKLNKKITVMAIDKSGNKRTVIVSSENAIPWYKNYLILVILIIGSILIYISGKFLWGKQK